MSDAKKRAYEAAMRRAKEMRANMESFKQQVEDIGLTGLSFDRWVKEFDKAEAKIQAEIDKAS